MKSPVLNESCSLLPLPPPPCGSPSVLHPRLGLGARQRLRGSRVRSRDSMISCARQRAPRCMGAWRNTSRSCGATRAIRKSDGPVRPAETSVITGSPRACRRGHSAVPSAAQRSRRIRPTNLSLTMCAVTTMTTRSAIRG